jgi:hypothetical protein
LPRPSKIEVYDAAAAERAHRKTEHFKKYAAVTKDMIAKRELRPLASGRPKGFDHRGSLRCRMIALADRGLFF